MTQKQYEVIDSKTCKGWLKILACKIVNRNYLYFE